MLSLLSFSTALQGMAAAAQAASAAVLDLSRGSPYRALLQASGSVMLWLQWLVLRVLSLVRAATCKGADLDSWMADFSFVRLAAVAASGNATFARFATAGSVLLPAGTQVKTADGSVGFVVGTDTAHGLWSVLQNGYLIPPGTSSTIVPVVAMVAGTAGNIQAGTLTLIASAVAGIDTVTNASGFTDGVDAEPDAAFLARFNLYIAGLRLGTLAAFQMAIANLRQGLVSAMVENYDHSGVYSPGLVTVYVDDGSGSPSVEVLASVTAEIEAVRGASIRVSVFGPTVLAANVAMTLITATGFTHATVVAQVQYALAAFINARPLGAGLAFTRLAQIAYDTSPGITNVTAVTLNSGTADLAGAAGQAIRAGTMSVA